MCPRLPIAAGVALGLLIAPSFTVAAATHIRLSRPVQGGALVRELTARAAGEAVAAGFSVELQAQPSSELAPADLVPAEAPPAAILIGPSGDDHEDGVIEVTVDGRQVYRATVRRQEVTPADGARILAAAAVSAVNALQAALLERRPPPAPAATASPAAAVSAPRVAMRAAPPAEPRLGIGVGAGVLQSLQGITPALVPTVRLSYRATGRLQAGLRLMALGTWSSATAPAGSARVRQTLALCDFTFRLGPARRFQPVVMAGGGLYHLSLEGTGTPPYVGRSVGSWHLGTDVGLGLTIGVTARVSITLESHAVWLWPQPSVRIESVEVGRAGRPSLTHGLGLLVWL